MLLQARGELLRVEWELAATAMRTAAARSRSRALKQEMEGLEARPSEMKELEREVKRLKAASSRTKDLEREIERLKTAAGPGSKRDVRQPDPENTQPRPKRDAKRGASKRSDAARSGTPASRRPVRPDQGVGGDRG
jgi:hypothetical protein